MSLVVHVQARDVPSVIYAGMPSHAVLRVTWLLREPTCILARCTNYCLHLCDIVVRTSLSTYFAEHLSMLACLWCFANLCAVDLDS